MVKLNRGLVAALFVTAALSGQTVAVEVRNTTATQAIVHVTATMADGSPYTGACSYRVSEGLSFTTLVNDVNPALFANANLDSRPGALTNGGQRYFVAGSRIAAKAADGKFYSRALQTNTQHWVGVTCGSAGEQTAVFKTNNLPLASAYPEIPAWDSGAFGNVAEPTIDWVDRSKTYIDPLTGVLMKRITGPLDYTGGDQQGNLFNTPLSVTSGWSNVTSANANRSTTTFATSSVPGASLFLPWFGAWQGGPPGFTLGGYDPSDVKIHAFCQGSGGAVLQACVSVDSGQTCATSIQEMACPSSFADVSAPSGYPSPMFTSWGGATSALTMNALKAPSTNVSVTGHIVTLNGGDTFYYSNRAPGSKLQIAGTAPACANNICTVASWDNPGQITLVENVSSTVSGSMADFGGGVLVTLKNTGGSPSVSANFRFDYITSQQFSHGSNSESYPCSTLPITDINTDAAGNPLGATLSGYLCVVGERSNGGSLLFLWIPSTGETRPLSQFQTSPGSGNHYFPFASAFSAADAKTFFANSNSGDFYRGVLGTAPYLNFNPLSGASDGIAWTDLSATSPPIATQIASAGGPVASALATGLFSPFQIQDLVNGQIYYSTAAGGDTPCLIARASADTNTLLDASTSYSTYPLRWGGCHSGAYGFGGTYRIWTVNPTEAQDPNRNLGGPYLLHITQMRRGGGKWATYSALITAATNANPVQFTVPAHGLDLGRTDENAVAALGTQVTISGATGTWAAVNGVWSSTYVDGDHLTIPIDTSGFGPITGSLVLSAAPPLIGLQITGSQITTTTPAMVTIVTAANNDPNLPQNHRLQDGDPITFRGDSSRAQYFAKVTGYSPTTFGVYADTALTIPVNGNSIHSFGNGQFVHFAETCPTPNRPWDQPNNIDSGASGARCITVRVAGEPCSYWATAAEHAAFPCPSDPSNTSKSSLQPIQPGDAIRDRGRNGYSETMTVVKKVVNSPTDIELTLERWTPNLVQGGDDSNTQSSASTHDLGWTPMMVPTGSHGCSSQTVSSTDPTHTFNMLDPGFCINHGDFGAGLDSSHMTYSGAAIPGAVDSIFNVTAAQLFATKLTYTSNGVPHFGNGLSAETNVIQSYANHRQVGAPGPEQSWKGDWAAINPANGFGASQGAPLFNGSVTPVAGTSHVYKIVNSSGGYARKYIPTHAWAGRYMFKDKSGPGSTIGDGDPWKYCVADFAGECVAGAAVNDTFISMPIQPQKSGVCFSDSFDILAPCFLGLTPLGGWAMQDSVNPIDTNASKVRRLTLGLNAPGMQWTFSSWLQTTGGQWGFFPGSMVNGLRNDFFAMKLPPWPGWVEGADSVNRMQFTPVTVKLSAYPGGQFARARFGYAENGAASNLYCTSRQETCSTDIPANAASDPYSFVSEAPTRQVCSAGCRVKIPAVAGRVLYYVIERLDSSGNLLWTSPLQALAVP